MDDRPDVDVVELAELDAIDRDDVRALCQLVTDDVADQPPEAVGEYEDDRQAPGDGSRQRIDRR